MERQPIDLFNELLRLSCLNQLSHQEPEATATALQRVRVTADMSQANDAQFDRLRSRLLIPLTTPSLGELLERVVQTTDVAEVISQTGLPISMVEQLRTDRLYPTQIPVMMMKRLLIWLQIPFLEAEAALQKTAERFSALVDTTTPQYGTAPLGRKTFRNAANTPSSEPGSRSRDLYANEDALRMYLNRLEQEMA